MRDLRNIPLTCAHCDAPIPNPRPNKHYCSPQCRRNASYARVTRDTRDTQDQHPATATAPTGIRRKPGYRERRCIRCGTLIPPAAHPQRVYCSAHCRQAAYRQRANAPSTCSPAVWEEMRLKIRQVFGDAPADIQATIVNKLHEQDLATADSNPDLQQAYQVHRERAAAAQQLNDAAIDFALGKAGFVTKEE